MRDGQVAHRRARPAVLDPTERSFDGASTREIAARAGVPQPLLAYHFRSKEDLWQAAVDSPFPAPDPPPGPPPAGRRGTRGLKPRKAGAATGAMRA